MAKYKNEEYGGRKILFVQGRGGIIFAQSPAISSQYIGVGRTKQMAFDAAKNVIDQFNAVNKKIQETKSMLCKYEDLEKDDSVDEYRLKGKVLRIYQDENPENPREWSNIGIMAYSHERYILGDEKLPTDRFDSWDEIEKYLIKERGAVVILPLYLYDHSGITIRTTPFGDRWDSGQVGFIYATKETMNEIGITKKDEVRKQLINEVKTYDQYITGDIFGFKLFECKNGNWEETDSMGGFFGSDINDNGMTEYVDDKGWRKV